MNKKVMYHQFLPKKDLRTFIHCYWVYRVPGQHPHEFNILPDGYFDVITFLQGNGNTILTGIWTKALSLTFANTTAVGIQFKPQFLGIRHLSVNSMVDSSSSFNLRDLSIDINEISRLAENEQSLVAYLDQSLARNMGNPDENNPTTSIFNMIDSRYLDYTLKDMGEEWGLSAKTIYRMVKKTIGISSKTYVDILKFRESLIQKNTMETYSGFYDQSHFIKTVKYLTGQTPEKLLHDRVRILQYRKDLLVE